MESCFSSLRSRLIAAIGVTLCALAVMFCMAVPAFAQDFTNPTDNVPSTTSIQIRANSGNVTTVTLGSATVPIQTDTKSAVYYKDSTWHVISTNSYVYLADVLSAANITASSYNYISPYVRNTNTDGSYSFANYTKYTPYIYSASTAEGLFYTADGTSNPLPFYGGITSSTLPANVSSLTASYTYLPIIALDTADGTIGAGQTASSVVSSFVSSDFTVLNSPRLLWGFDSQNYGGNRFPSYIVGISVIS